MRFVSRLVVAVAVCICANGLAWAADDAHPTLFRVFLRDGRSVVSVGEVTRVDDRVIFSMPVGGTPQDPQLHPVTLPASLVDWTQTDRYTTSARFQQYAPRAEADYQRLTDEVAALLNDIAVSTDKPRAVALAEEARARLLDWPRAHFGYRQDDVRDIVGLLDSAIARLRGTTPARGFEVSLVASAPPAEIVSLATMPAPREQLDQLVHVLGLTTSPQDRQALLHAGLALISAARSRDIDPGDRLRESLERQLRREVEVDRRYAKLTQQLASNAARAAADADIGDVERVLQRIPREDKKLGGLRPEVVQALTASVRHHLNRARQLRLLRDQWSVRKSLFRDYQRRVGSEVVQLVKVQSSLEAIRKLEGPEPNRLIELRSRLSGGAARLQRMQVPEYLRATHDLVVSAWRFAENAANARYAAVTSGELSTAWEASSAAAGALMMLTRAQDEIRKLLEPPTLP